MASLRSTTPCPVLDSGRVCSSRFLHDLAYADTDSSLADPTDRRAWTARVIKGGEARQLERHTLWNPNIGYRADMTAGKTNSRSKISVKVVVILIGVVEVHQHGLWFVAFEAELQGMNVLL